MLFNISKSWIDANLAFKSKSIKSKIDLCLCIINNIITKTKTDNVDNNFIQRMSVVKWQEILCENLNIVLNFDITYKQNDEILRVNKIQHLKIAMSYAKTRDLNKLIFWIKLHVMHNREHILSLLWLLNEINWFYLQIKCLLSNKYQYQCRIQFSQFIHRQSNYSMANIKNQFIFNQTIQSQA